jgi:hypothetical protein
VKEGRIRIAGRESPKPALIPPGFQIVAISISGPQELFWLGRQAQSHPIYH